MCDPIWQVTLQSVVVRWGYINSYTGPLTFLKPFMYWIIWGTGNRCWSF